MQPFLQPAGRETLQSFVAEKFNGLPFVVVSNREPYIHYLEGDEVPLETDLGRPGDGARPDDANLARLLGGAQARATRIGKPLLRTAVWACRPMIQAIPNTASG